MAVPNSANPGSPVLGHPTPAPQSPKPTISVSAAGKKLPRSDGIKSVLSTIVILLIAPILALAITAFLFQSYEVSGPSMQSTLQDHDRLIIWKAPKTLARITGHDYIPHRGDVIVFVKKGLYDFDANKEKQLIKRVIGLPGERVVVKDNVMTVYNKANPNGFQPDKTLPYGRVITETPGNVDLTVPAGEVFVSGDNRTNSLDSRYFGTIPSKDIIGKLIVRVLPANQAKTF